MLHSLIAAGAFGFLGALVWSTLQLSAALYLRVDVTPELKKLAWTRWGIALVAGPTFAIACSPIISDMLPGVGEYGAGAVVGVFVMPIINQATQPGFIRKILAIMLRGLATQIDGPRDDA